jgi:hypothetical protein
MILENFLQQKAAPELVEAIRRGAQGGGGRYSDKWESARKSRMGRERETGGDTIGAG